MTGRVVFDTSTLVSAALRVGSTPHRALMHAVEFWQLCGSGETLAELVEVLQRDRFHRYLREADRQEFIALIRRATVLYQAAEADRQPIAPLCRDPKDDLFLVAAVAAEAAVLVSSDSDLLVLHPWRGIAILTPAQFLLQFAD